jgi:formylglycine-generating enzyme
MEKLKIVILFCFLQSLFINVQVVSATVIWCNPNNLGNMNGLSKKTGYDTLHKVFDKMTSGDKVIIANGDWRNVAGMEVSWKHRPPSGTSRCFTSVLAESDWGVKLPFIRIETPSSKRNGYILFRGIVFDNKYTDFGGMAGGHICYNMHHCKFIRCGFLAHGLKANTHTCGFGSSDSTRSVNQYNLMEECIAWGSGRDVFYSKFSKYNIFRRCVARHDYHDGQGTKDDGQISNFRAYACDFNVYQNCISIDSDRIENYSSVHPEACGFLIGDIYGADGNEINGCISIKDVQLSYYISGRKAKGNAVIMDSIALDITVPGGNTLSAFVLQSEVNLSASNLLGMMATKKGQDGFFKKKVGDYTVRNSILRDVRDLGLRVTLAENINHYNAGECVFLSKLKNKLRLFLSCWGANSTDYDPMQNGLMYPVRIESGSPLASAGTNGSRCGPEILKKIGVSGTLYGEPGWNEITDENLWPYPNEEKIRELMRETVAGVSGIYGFCSDGQTLSHYIWGYLGKTVPPFNVKATAGDKMAKLVWSPPASIALDSIVGFNVYDVTGGTRILLGGVNGNEIYSKKILDLVNGKSYEFAITTVDSKKGESGLSYKVRVTPPNLGEAPEKKTASTNSRIVEKRMEPSKIAAKKIFINKLGMKFVLIPSGTFTMGVFSNKEHKSNNTRSTNVTLTKKFYMQQTEVTQGQWKKLMGKNPSFFKKCGDGCPVEQVSWNDVQEFINRLNRMEGLDKYRLPTEAEWEYSCRSDQKASFAFGNCLATSDANYNGEFPYPGCEKGIYRQSPIAAGLLSPNLWGLYDMHGNVWEWCQDWLGDYASNTVADPLGSPSSSLRVIRGGAWNSYANACRSDNRSGIDPAKRFANLGFRLVRQP